MRRNILRNTFIGSLSWVFLLGSVSSSQAQVKHVEMHIAGNLCGNCMSKVQKAVSRLNYAPKPKDIKIMDIRRGIGMFTPKPDRPVSFVALKETLKNAGYTLDAAVINVTGTLARADEAAFLIVWASGQRFSLEDINWHQALARLASGSSIEIIGDWKTIVGGTNSDEVIVVRRARKVGDPTAPKVATLVHPSLRF